MRKVEQNRGRRGWLKRVLLVCVGRVEMGGQVASVEAVSGGRKFSQNRGGSDSRRGARFGAVRRRVIRSAEAAVFMGAEGGEDRGLGIGTAPRLGGGITGAKRRRSRARE